MKLQRRSLGALVVFTATALLFLVLDGRMFRVGAAWTALPAVLAHVALLTLVVGAWIWAMVYGENDELTAGSA